MLKSMLLLWLVFGQTGLIWTMPDEHRDLSGPYLGQNPPGNIPDLFAPGTVSRDDYFEHSAAIFSPDNREVYWSGKPIGARYFEIYAMKTSNGLWTEPQVAFSHKEYNFGNPVLSADGRRLFFDSRGDIWFVERTGDGWTHPAQVSSLINSEGSEALRCVTADGSIYFSRYNITAALEGQKHEIYVSRQKNGHYLRPEKLDKTINSDESKELALFVAPDESYMIIEATKDSRTSDLFIIYQMNDGSWSKRMELPFKNGRFPSVSPDGKYLFFMRRDDGIYWVNTSFITDLKKATIW